MALRPGAGAGGSGGGGSFMFPVTAGIGPSQGMMPVQQQPHGFPIVPMMQPGMQNMMGVGFGSQVPQPALIQGGMPMGPMQATGMPFMGQPAFLGMRTPTQQFIPDMQKQFVEEQQKRFEQQQKMLEEERKRRQFEEQKQKLRLLSSVKPKTCEKSRDDALEAIKGNLDGFSRDAKMHPTPVLHTKKTDFPSSPHSSVSVSSHATLLGADEEFSDFVQGPVKVPSVPSMPSCVSGPVGQMLSEQAVTVSQRSPVRSQGSTSSHGTNETLTVQSTSTTKFSAQKRVGVGIFPTTDPVQQMLPSWIYNDSLIPELYKVVLDSSMTPTGIDTAKLYPILMSSGLPRETLGQIWALANRTTPGKLIKEELYTVLAMIAITQRGGPVLSTDVLNQFSSAPVPTLSGFPMSLSSTVNQLHIAPTSSAAPRPVNIAPPVISLNRPTSGVVAPQNTMMHPLPTQQCGKSEDDDFQDFQDASKSGPIDISFSDFQSDISVKPTTSQSGISAPPMLIPMSGTAETASSSSDKYAVFKSINMDKSSENPSTFADFEDKYHAFRELEKPPENKSFGDGFADIKSGADDGFTDFKTADSISPLDPSAKDSHLPSPFTTVQHKSPTQTSFNVAELDPFSSVTVSSTINSFPFTAAFPSTTSSSPVPPLPSSSSSLTASSFKTSSVPDDFGDFSLFGGSANAGSTSSQNDFADFMAFNSDTSSSEQKKEDKPKAIKLEPSPLGPQTFTAHTTQAIQPASSAADKYDIFKQLSLENSGLAYDESKYTIPSMKNDDDFADFQSDKFTIAETSSEKSFVDKIASFKQAKEDSASVKSLDLPSIGGSSVGKEDSEDALSIQFDMKLADVGGDLKHVMSDSSLDLASVSSQHPPAADDFKSVNDRNDSALNILTSYDWSEKDNIINQNKKQSDIFLSSDSSAMGASTLIFQKKETSFGSSENITMTTVSKVTTFSNEDYLQEIKMPGSTSTRLFAEDPSSDILGNGLENGSALEHGSVDPEKNSSGIKSTDDFGEFQREKPKTSKFDFLMATAQGKVKSSEEMIKSELATLDLCSQGSHKRSLSLGDKEISRSSPAPDQPFRDRSNTLSEKPVLPVIRDKYKDLTGEVEESERYAYEWQRCLESALQVIKKANDTLNGISSSSVCTEVIQSAQGMEYLLGVVEVYRVTKRVELGIKATAVCSEKLQHLLKETEKVWNNLISFMSLAALMPDESALDFTSCVLRPGIKNAQELACGVCLLNVDSRSKAFNSETDNFKLSYGGHQYHASCANFWINCVEPKPPGLFLPDLL
ncbi:synergin gamma isoform X2 [Spea bombifrons]|uniref:synergin gamma isoform X2 n=1 Tax=Spea bombifrons TaxID=233779 RepID=UPI002349E2C0|nr:synergin gamma isoform X2 [Spea bombifrons]